MLTYMNTAAAARTKANIHAFMVFPLADRILDIRARLSRGAPPAAAAPSRNETMTYTASAEKKMLLIRISSCYLPNVSAGRDGSWLILTGAGVIEGLRPGRAPP